jgi:hypothetical protein
MSVVIDTTDVSTAAVALPRAGMSPMPHTTAALPPIGKVFEVNFGGDFVFRFRFDSKSQMTLVGMAGEFKGVTEFLNIAVEPIRPGLFIVAWQEKAKTTVVQLQDYERGLAYIAVTRPDNSFLRMRGHLKALG